MPALIYLQPMHGYPTAEVHSIQITRTVGALGNHVEVLLVAGSLSVEPAKLPVAVRDYYGVEFGPKVRVVTMPGSVLHAFVPDGPEAPPLSLDAYEESLLRVPQEDGILEQRAP
jgi:hypothetical protein